MISFGVVALNIRSKSECRMEEIHRLCFFDDREVRKFNWEVLQEVGLLLFEKYMYQAKMTGK